MLKKRIALLMALVMAFSAAAVVTANPWGTEPEQERFCRCCMFGEIEPLTAQFDANGDPLYANYSIVVSPRRYDDIGSVLGRLIAEGNLFYDGNPETPITGFYQMMGGAERLNDLNWVSQFSKVFVNCGIFMDPQVARAFVENGGLLYASDLALSFVATGFPEAQITALGTPAGAQQILQIADPALQIALNGATSLPGTLWAPGGGRVPSPNINYQIVDVLAYGVAAGGQLFPSILTFAHGEGRVFYMTFHVAAGNTQEMEDILEFMVNFIIFEPLWVSLSQIASALGLPTISSPLTGVLQPGETTTFTFNLESPTDFAILNSAVGMSNFTMSLTAPNGVVFNGSSVLPISIFAAEAGMSAYNLGQHGMAIRNGIEGEWSFTVTNHSGESNFILVLASGHLVPNVPAVFGYQGVQQFRSGGGPRWSVDRGPVVPFPALNRSAPAGQNIVVANEEVEVQARESTNRLTLIIPVAPSDTIDALISEASDGVVSFDITNFPDAEVVVITRAALRRFANANLTLEFVGADGVAEVNPVIELNNRGTGNISINLAF